MDATPQHILDQARRLSEDDRAALAATLIDSLGAGVDLDSDDKWAWYKNEEDISSVGFGKPPA